MGMFGDGFDDPKSAAILALSGNMIRGDFGGGMLDAGTAYNGAMDSRIKRADALQQLQQRNIALQQAQQEWDMRLPFMRALAARFQGGQAAGGGTQGGSTFAGPMLAGPAPAASASQPAVPPMAGGALGSGTFGIPVGGQAAAAPAAPAAPRGSFMGIPDDVLTGTIGLEGFKGLSPLIAKFNEPTEYMKTLEASGVQRGSPEWNRALADNLRKTNYIAPTRLGEGAYNDPQSGVQGLPTTAPPGYINQRGGDGTWSTVPVLGGLKAVADSTSAKTLGKADATVTTQFNEATGKYEPITEGQQARAAWSASPSAPAAFGQPSLPAPMRANNPGALMPGGKLAQFDTPEQGIAALDKNLQFYASQGINTVQGVISKWAPPNENDTGAYINNVATLMGVKPDQPLDMSSPVVRHMLAAGIMKQENGSAAFAASASGPGGSVVPKPSPGFEAGATELAKAGAQRYNTTIAQASDSPMRVNVYDNILNLSKNGVATGPGESWKNTVKGYVANTPVLSMVSKGWKDDVSGFQELNKFMYQNAQRNWQAAGGTGTDSQLEAFSRSNPNDKMFPSALQAMAEWGKAGELALQGKANAMQAWRQQGGNIAKQDQFETNWRQNFDPVLFQLKTMDPSKASAYVNDLKAKNPNAYNALMQKASTLKSMGGL